MSAPPRDQVCTPPWVTACHMEASFACGLQRAGKVWGRTSQEVQHLRYEYLVLSSHHLGRPTATQHSNLSFISCRVDSLQSGT